MRGGQWWAAVLSLLLVISSLALVRAEDSGNLLTPAPAALAPVTAAPVTQTPVTSATVTFAPVTAAPITPSFVPSTFPSLIPSGFPSDFPSLIPSFNPSRAPRNETTAGGACGGFIRSRFLWNESMGPFPIDCQNQTFSRWGPSEHQSSACCTDEGRYVVQTSQVGGFDITFKSGGTQGSGVGHQCLAFTEALRATLCDPEQGKHVLITPDNQTYLRICRSSCDAVFNECGMPGSNYPSDLAYTDGTSMCYEAWGGWYQTSCDKNSKQFPCESITALHVIDDVSEGIVPLPAFSGCLSIIYPTSETLDVYEETRQPPDACRLVLQLTSYTLIIVWITVSFFLCCCGHYIAQAWLSAGTRTRILPTG